VGARNRPKGREDRQLDSTYEYSAKTNKGTNKMSNTQNTIIEENKQENWEDRCDAVFEYFELADGYMDSIYEEVHHDDVDQCHEKAFEYFCGDISEEELKKYEHRIELMAKVKVDLIGESLFISQGLDGPIEINAFDLDQLLAKLERQRQEHDKKYAIANKRESYYPWFIKMHTGSSIKTEGEE